MQASLALRRADVHGEAGLYGPLVSTTTRLACHPLQATCTDQPAAPNDEPLTRYLSPTPPQVFPLPRQLPPPRGGAALPAAMPPSALAANMLTKIVLRPKRFAGVCRTAATQCTPSPSLLLDAATRLAS